MASFSSSPSSVDALINSAFLHEMQRIKDDLLYFIQHYVKIEDKSNSDGQIIVPFILWDAQKKALFSIDQHKFNIVLKARQLGLTWLCLAYAAHFMMVHPGSLVIALSRTEKEAKELARRLGNVIFANMPQLVDQKGSHGRFMLRSKSLLVELVDPLGRVSSFSVFTSSKGAGRSFSADLLFIDEWAFQQWAEEIWASALPTINRPGGGKVIGISTIERGSLFEQLWTEDNQFNKIFIPWDADPSRDLLWYQQTKSVIGDLIFAEYPASPEEALLVPGGAFFPEFKEEIHCKPYSPMDNSLKFVSFDYGLDALAVLWYEMDSDGFVQVYRELYTSDLAVRDAAQAVISANNGDKISKWFAPPDLWNRNRDSGRSTAAVFRACGIPLTKTDNRLEQGWLNVKDYLRVFQVLNPLSSEVMFKSTLTIDPFACPNLVRCLKKIQKDKLRPNIAAHDPHELTHLPDSLRAFCQGRPKPLVVKPKTQKYAFDDFLKPAKNHFLGEEVDII